MTSVNISFIRFIFLLNVLLNPFFRLGLLKYLPSLLIFQLVLIPDPWTTPQMAGGAFPPPGCETWASSRSLFWRALNNRRSPPILFVTTGFINAGLFERTAETGTRMGGRPGPTDDNWRA